MNNNKEILELIKFNEEMEICKIDKKVLIKLLADTVYELSQGDTLDSDKIEEITMYLKEHNIDSKFVYFMEDCDHEKD